MLNSTLKVKVSFTDAATTPNAEDQTSRASLKVVPTANTAATGKPTISGPASLRVTHTLTAGTSAISDSDGVTGVTFGYQWVRVDGGTDTDIAGATESSYVLETDDEGKTVKVKVSFADNNRNAESVVSDASAVVGSAPNRPPTFPDTTASREAPENTPADQGHRRRPHGHRARQRRHPRLRHPGRQHRLQDRHLQRPAPNGWAPSTTRTRPATPSSWR